jgi:hypothetical protein
VTGGAPTPSALTAQVAAVPSGGYTLAAGDALVGVRSANAATRTGNTAVGKTAARAATTGTAATAQGLTSSLAASVLRSQQVLAGAAKRAAAAHPASASPTASSSPAVKHAAASPAATSLSCHASSGMLPQNVTAIVSFLLAHGYSHNAAAGIAGNMYQESKGDPESVGMGGGGLIGFTPLPAGYVTGNTAADLQVQLNAVLKYNQIWAQYLSALNGAATPADAAYIYVTDFERAGIPAAATREASAQAVASACGI